MGATSQPELHRIAVRVPRGQDGFWRIMRQLDAAHGEFTVTDIEGGTNVPRESVEHYVQRLTKGGFLKPLRDVAVAGTPFKAKVYRLLRRPATAPRLRDDGTPVPPTAQERLWLGMRNLRQFDAKELAFTASMPGALVPRKTAQRYINQLETAGYLSAFARGVYRLKPAMNTGPLPPSILKIDAVWDRNRKKLIGPAVHDAAEVA